ncbi:polyamine ABC transporter substrate-binding protein [uncultured Amphritea sp.]|uniref:polyamine ABC transporter substrate-binding protein n=1 Tax=Amphritea sp. TaxID=1872502 RepID=UPI0025F0DA2F|nr:polyamine ABC transporter substrate-binding protein [uncultured Amphritea sp.]
MRINKKILSLCLLTASYSVSAAQVNVYNWFGYIPEDSLQVFKDTSKTELNYDVYDSNEILETKLLSGGSRYDLVVPSANFMERQVKADIYQEIDRSKIPNYNKIDPVILKKVEAYDPGNQYSVPYAWGSVGVGYNVKMIKERLGEIPENTFDMVFDPDVSSKLKDCGIAVLDSPAEAMAMALHYLGLDPNSEDKKDLKKAEAMVRAARGNYKYFHSGSYRDDIANGDICVALGYNGMILAGSAIAKTIDPEREIAYSIPKVGSLIWFDVMAIPADAPNPDGAHEFINFILEPEIGSSISNLVKYAVPNLGANEYVEPDIFNNPGIYPSDEVKETLFALNAHTQKYDRILNRAWTNIKANR